MMTGSFFKTNERGGSELRKRGNGFLVSLIMLKPGGRHMQLHDAILVTFIHA